MPPGAGAVQFGAMRPHLIVPSLLAAICLGASAAEADTPTVIARADALVKEDKGAEAIALLEAWAKDHPEDKEARARLLTLQVAAKEAELRSLVKEQADERDLMLADKSYDEAKGRSARDVARRLTAAEYLIAQGRATDALETVNAILRDHPEDQAALRMKYRLLERLAQRQREVLVKNRKGGHDRAINEVISQATLPEEKPAVRRQVFTFDEDIDELERARVQHQLEQKVESLVHDKAKVWDVMQQLFTLAGIQYVVVDSAIGEETISLNIQNATIQSVLETVGKLAKVRFAYDRGMVYVDSSDNDNLVTEIIRLKSGLTNVEAPATSTSFQGGSGTGSGSGDSTGNPTNRSGVGANSNNRLGENGQNPSGNGNNNRRPTPGAGGGAANPNGGAGSGATNGQSDLEKLLAKVPDIIVGWPADGRFHLDRKSNTLYVKSTPWAIAELKRLLNAIDYNNVQVLIQARFVEVSEDAFRTLGIKWEGGFGKNPDNPVVRSVLGSAGGTSPNGAASNLIAGTLGQGKTLISANLSALEQENKADTLAEPKILTLNNSEGNIEIVSNRTYVSNYTLQANGYSNSTTNGTVVTNQSNVATPQLQTIETGIQLKIRPSVARNSNIITLHLQPTIREEDLTNTSRFQDFRYVSNPNSSNETTLKYETPTVATRTLETSLHIENGESVALGGMIKERDSSGRESTPFLSSIPVLGGLFGSKTAQNQRSNLVIFVTANIVDPSGAKVGDEIEQLRDTARILLPHMDGEVKDAAPSTQDAAAPKTAPAKSEPTPHIGPNFDKNRR